MSASAWRLHRVRAALGVVDLELIRAQTRCLEGLRQVRLVVLHVPGRRRGVRQKHADHAFALGGEVR
jgi:hypothetical protein